MATRQGTTNLLGTSRPFPAAAVVEPVIAPARLRDLFAVGRLHHRCFSPSLAYRLSTMFALFLWPRAQFLVVRAGSEIVGCAVGDTQGGQSRVITICVDPEWRRRGIASALLSELEARLTTGNVILMVEAGNTAAQTLYRRCGYLQVGESHNYYGRGRHGIWMQKTRG